MKYTITKHCHDESSGSYTLRIHDSEMKIILIGYASVLDFLIEYVVKEGNDIILDSDFEY